jgi:hypothetical protein
MHLIVKMNKILQNIISIAASFEAYTSFGINTVFTSSNTTLLGC